jgi:hypothetical protein
LVVKVLNDPGKFFDEPRCLPARIGLRVGNCLRKRVALDVLHHQVWLAFPRAHIVDVDDLGMTNSGQDQSLCAESAILDRAGRGTGDEHLDRHQTVERDLPGLVDHPHAAPSNFSQYLETRDVRQIFG